MQAVASERLPVMEVVAMVRLLLVDLVAVPMLLREPLAQVVAVAVGAETQPQIMAARVAPERCMCGLRQAQ